MIFPYEVPRNRKYRVYRTYYVSYYIHSLFSWLLPKAVVHKLVYLTKCNLFDDFFFRLLTMFKIRMLIQLINSSKLHWKQYHRMYSVVFIVHFCYHMPGWLHYILYTNKLYKPWCGNLKSICHLDKLWGLQPLESKLKLVYTLV